MQAKVAVVMGSTSDWPVMQHAAETLDSFGVEYEARVVSAHRTPDLLSEFGKSARETVSSVSSPAPAAPRICPACWPRTRCCRCSECRFLPSI